MKMSYFVSKDNLFVLSVVLVVLLLIIVGPLAVSGLYCYYKVISRESSENLDEFVSLLWSAATSHGSHTRKGSRQYSYK